MLRIFLLTACIGLLTACASTTPEKGQQADTTAQEPAIVVEAPLLPERRIPDDSLYPLLVAEFAIRRGAYDLALENYMDQAPVLRDAGVSGHTTQLGQFLQRDEDALEAARLWAELSPEDLEANSALATLLVREGLATEAIPYLAILERSGTHPRFPALLGNFREMNDVQREELIQGIETLATDFPDNTELLLTQALIDTEMQQYDEALNKLDQLLELDPHQHTALLMEAEILLKQDARKPFARLERTLKDTPEEKMLRLKYARLLTGVDLSAAREQFEILAAQSPQDTDLLFSLGLLNREMQDYLAAENYLNQVIETDERTNEANYYLGRLAEDRDKPLEAIPFYLLVEDSRELMPANSRIGAILVKNGQLDQSHDVFGDQRTRFPQHGESLYVLEMDILTKAKHTERSETVLEEGLRIYPESQSLQYARAMMLEQQGELDAMERDLRNIIDKDPTNATALNALGYTLANRTDRYDEALELIGQALALEPDEPAILDSMGWVLYRTGRYDEALDYLARAHANFPDAEVAAHFGEVLWVTGSKDHAIDVWTAAYLKDSDHAILNSTLERLGVELSQSLTSGADD